ncbi:MAG: M48 family peptidase, partial [Paludibacter sp.]|nr:M48 family peptidase [Paludibacter sp.]
MVEALLIVIIAILALEFGFDRYLTILNIRHSRKQLPEILADIYDKDKYNRQQDYFRTNARFGLLTSVFSFVIILLMYVLGGFGWLDRIVQLWTDQPILQLLLFFGILFIINDIINIPFDWCHTFVIEEKFEFNKVTPTIFITDKLKSWGVSIFIGGLILSAIIWIYTLTPQYFWLLAFAVTTIFSLVMG